MIFIAWNMNDKEIVYYDEIDGSAKFILHCTTVVNHRHLPDHTAKHMHIIDRKECQLKKHKFV